MTGSTVHLLILFGGDPKGIACVAIKDSTRCINLLGGKPIAHHLAEHTQRAPLQRFTRLGGLGGKRHTIMRFTQKDLKDGKNIIFHTKDKDDLREADLSFSIALNKFVIWFNGQLIHSSKTFKALENRFEILKNKWDLEFNRIEE